MAQKSNKYQKEKEFLDNHEDQGKARPWAIIWSNAGHVYIYVSHWGRLYIKMSSYQYWDPHVKDKTVSSTVLSLKW